MLWIVGSLFIIIWLVEKFLLHKGGMVHILLLVAISLFLSQFVQDRRTKAHRRSPTR
jgi:hypothetical protein